LIRRSVIGNTRADAASSPRIANNAAASSAGPCQASELRDAKRTVIGDLQQEAIAARLGGADMSGSDLRRLRSLGGPLMPSTVYDHDSERIGSPLRAGAAFC
jgi:hypothetical protein